MSKFISLHETSGFTNIMTLYEQNKEKPWFEWMDVDSVFPHPGKQGLVGLMEVKSENKEKMVFKISQYINYLVQHELTIMKGLNEISDFCPHFCKGIGAILCEVDPLCRKEGNPFEMNSPYIIKREVMLMEHLQKTHKFFNYIRSEKSNENLLYSTIKQVLLSIAIAQRKKFTHYDLHSNNIMMRKCSKNTVFLYIMDEENQFCVPTYGAYPIIIDFGFSYIEDMNGGPLWPSMGHTTVGFLSNEFDRIADPKLFLVSVSSELKIRRGTKKSKKLRNIVKNNFAPLNIKWDCGWDKGPKYSIADLILDKIEKEYKNSKLFQNYDHYCIDILQTLIILPIEKQDYTNLRKYFSVFIKEFTKIEEQISSPFFCLYILKGIVDAVRMVRSDYNNKNTREHAVNFFKAHTLECVDSVAKYCKLKDLHYEKMLCSLLCLGKCIEGFYYEKLKEIRKVKNKSYKKIPLQTCEELVSTIDINIPSEYEFNEKTTVFVVDALKNKMYTLELTETDISELNDMYSISWGPYLYKKC